MHISRLCNRGVVGLLAAGALLGSSMAPARADTDPPPISAIADKLQQTMDGLRLQDVLDTDPVTTTAAARTLTANAVDKDAQTPKQQARLLAAAADAQPISQQPQLDATVIELDEQNRPISSGTVLMSPQYPHGKVVPVDRNFHTSDVRWRQWDDSGWYTNHGQGTIDVVPGRENASTDFMLPYPASVLKLMINFGVLRLVDKGVVKLDDTYAYNPTSISSLCGGASSDTIRNYIDASLTWSSNGASCALLKMLWDHDAVSDLNQTFQDLGLETLQVKETNPANGGHWSNPVTMSSLDTAKLLALINGAPGTVWTTPNGKAVTSDVLSPASREFFKKELAQQGMNDVLSTVNWCGADYPAPGIPQLVPSRWIAADGTVTVDGDAYQHDVRPCNAKAEVTFAHKTGLVSNSGSDAGIVRSLPGKTARNYIIVVFSNLGNQYIDPNRPPTAPGAHPVAYSEKYAQLGLAIDQYEARHYFASRR
ncbi:class A beta-lactamase-related serine hydrolase [Actinoallomurus spadix]|nr:serine hydrolase [Actinoallomurus spadix]MCO5988226.1 class A beta-lactamase-related serine hydrolase [Actinoallomurus spadix]